MRRITLALLIFTIVGFGIGYNSLAQRRSMIMKVCSVHSKVSVYQLTHLPMRNLHTYYDVSPWSPDSQRIVFSAMEKPSQESRELLSSSRGILYIADSGGQSR